MKALSVSVDVARGIVREGKMSEKQFLRVKTRNGIERSVPKFDRNVRWGSNRKDERMPVDRNACRVPDERDRFLWIEIGNVMGGVTGRIKDLKLTGSDSDGFAAVKHLKILSGHRQKFAE